jgi:hypothetical protein
LFRRARLHNAPGAHYDDPIRYARNDTKIVRYEHHPHPLHAFQLSEQREDLRLNRHVQGSRGFVCDDQLRTAGKRHGNHHPLTHPAGELVRKLIHPATGIGHVNLSQEFQRSGTRIAPRHAPMLHQRLCDLVPDPEMRCQRREGILKHHAHVRATPGVEVTGRHPDQLLALQARAAADSCVRRQQPHHCQQRLALPSARLADDSDALAGFDTEREVGDCLHLAGGSREGHAQIANLEQRRRLNAHAGPVRRAGRRRES